MSALDRRLLLKGLGATAALGALPAWTKNPERRSQWPAVEALLQQHLAERKFPGVLVAVSVSGAPPQYVTAGTLAFESPVAVDENSLWRIKSMTKQVTGVATMMLIDDGQLALDQPVGDVLPALRSLRVAVDLERSLASRPAQRSVTVRHLLTHTSGLSYWIPSSGEGLLPRLYRQRGITPGNYYPWQLSQPGYGPQASGLKEMVERLSELPLSFEPGTSWLYSIGPDVMGAVIERLTGSFAGFLRRRLFGPLGMNSTAFQVAPEDARRLTSNYRLTPAGPELLDAGPTSVFLRPSNLEAGGAGLVSSARDFMRFGAMLLGGGALDGVRVLRPETARLMVSDLLPNGLFGRSGSGARGFGAGGAVVLPGDTSTLGAPGSFGGGGAAGTIWTLDPANRLVWLFMSQHMPPRIFHIQREVGAAIADDLRLLASAR